MFSCDCVVTRLDGSVQYLEGSFFRLPPELGGRNKIEAYSRLTRNGWHTIDHGYLAFVFARPSGVRLCFPGALPNEASFKNRLRVSPEFSARHLENYVGKLINYENAVNSDANDDLNLVVHDLRRLSGVIYNAAEEAKAKATNPELIRLVDNIIGAQSMLKIRVDMIDFSGDVEAERDSAHVSVFRKVDKVVRSFRPMAERSDVFLYLRGSSYATSRGPDILEIVPYILIDNAIKYSPRNGSVDVFVAESPDSVSFSVASIGPEIRSHEKERIFERGYRGELTRQRSDAGSGLGLFLCKQIVSSFGGSIVVVVGDRDIPTSKGPCRDIKFEVTLPKSS